MTDTRTTETPPTEVVTDAAVAVAGPVTQSVITPVIAGEVAGDRVPLAYHRLAHLDPRTARWWRPFATLGVGAGLLLALGVILALVAVLVILVFSQRASFPAALTPSVNLDDPRNPMDHLLGLGLLALLIPVVVFALRWGGGQRGTVHSVVGRFRWGMALRAAALVLPGYALVLWTASALSPPEDLSMPPFDASLLAVVIIVLLLTPLQCAAEEYAFRGLPMQLFGTWLRTPVVGLLLPVPLFMLGHEYDWAGQIGIAAFALSMGFLVWKSGGLELAVVVHTANNLPLFLASPLSPTSLQQGAVDPWLLLVSLSPMLATTAVLTVWVSRTHGVGLLEPVRGHGRAPHAALAPGGSPLCSAAAPQASGSTPCSPVCCTEAALHGGSPGYTPDAHPTGIPTREQVGPRSALMRGAARGSRDAAAGQGPSGQPRDGIGAGRQ